jgi:hypothetical protein
MIPMKEILDLVLIEMATQFTKEILESSFHFKTEWLALNDWIAVPVESALHFDTTDAENIARALNNFGHTNFLAVATEDLGNFPRFFRVDANTQDILTFNRTCSFLNFLLFPDSRSFGILCTVYDYFIIAGTTEFVECALNSSIETARLNFEEFALSFTTGYSSDSSKSLLSVSKRYWGL